MAQIKKFRVSWRILLASIFFFIACNGDGKTDHVSSKNGATKPTESTSAKRVQNVEIPKTVDEIKKAYQNTIQNLRSGDLDSIAFKYDCSGERSGTVTYFSHQNKLRLIKHQYQEYDHFSATDQYFIIDENLFFVHFNRLTWSFDSEGAAEGATKDDIVEQRVYIVDRQPIQCLEKKFTIRSSSKDNPNANEIANKKIDCKSLKPVSKSYEALLAFRNAAKKDCLAN